MTEEIKFKEKFIERYSELTDWEQFRETSLKYLRRSVRINTLKASVEDVGKSLGEKGWGLTQIPWCDTGFFVKHKEGRRDIGNTKEHMLGYIYVQEAVSMIPPLVLKPGPGETVLDMCAAPGSKASQIAAMMENKGVLVANDFKGIRLASLGINFQRVGVTNAILTLMEGRWFKDMEFDKILVDAPCSGTGTIAKSFKTLKIWNPNMVKRLAGTQRLLIKTAFNCLKKGGTMVYSTCTMEPEEDEAVISYLLSEFEDAKIEEIPEEELPGLKRSPVVTEFDGKEFNPEVKKCLRLWPQDNETEGFFVCKIKKV